eukprot:1689058-Lingulodinium_polyedra.AAC.1
MRGASPPIRLSASATGASTQGGVVPRCEEIRLARPQVGHDRYWVVWTQGEVVPEYVEAQLAASLRGVVRAREAI